jgi:hypothetical protein
MKIISLRQWRQRETGEETQTNSMKNSWRIERMWRGEERKSEKIMAKKRNNENKNGISYQKSTKKRTVACASRGTTSAALQPPRGTVRCVRAHTLRGASGSGAQRMCSISPACARPWRAAASALALLAAGAPFMTSWAVRNRARRLSLGDEKKKIGK